MRNFLSKQEALEYFQKNNPYSTCDYLLTIDNCKLDKFYALKGFQFPKAGVSYQGNGIAGFPHPTPHVEFGEISLDVIMPKPQKGDLTNQFNKLWGQQFNTAGELIFIPASQRPQIVIQTMDENADILFFASGCTFGYPTPTVNYGSDDTCIFHVSVWYEDARVYPVRWDENIARRRIDFNPELL